MAMHHVGDYLGRRASKRLVRGVQDQADLLAAVRRALPPALAGHCVGAVRQDQRITLIADSPLWATRLRFAAPELLGRLTNPAQGNWEIRVRICLPDTEVRPKPMPPPRPMPQWVARRVESIATTLLSGALRDAWLRLARRASASTSAKKRDPDLG